MTPPSTVILTAVHWRRAAALTGTVLAAFAVASLDLASRARAAYRRAEGLERLARRPADREQALERAFLDGVADLDRRRLSAPEREVAVEILRKRWEEDRLRSPWTDAYHAWRDVYSLYAPPETLRVRRARLLAPADRQRWREDWTARRLPFQENFLDLEPGEEGGYRLLYSTPDQREASRALNVLETLDLPCRFLPPPVPAAPAGRDIRLLVPEERFWEAHRALLPLVGLDENL